MNSLFSIIVPNAPCGVERYVFVIEDGKVKEFLMHRVELKEILGGLVKITHEKFLMYRVELKVCWTIFFLMLPPPFLMYRVELKELFPHPKKIPRLCSS